MKQLWTVTKNEFYRYFISPLAYVYLISFLILNGSFALYFGHWFDRGQADLLPMFGFQPWLYLLFIPGISMRLWSEEFRTKTILQIITMPVPISVLIWGKFLASWLFCAVALLLTFPFWITVNLLGSPDNTVIFISYLGSFLLAGCMLSISQTMSALTKNQVIALVLAVIANLVFFLSGIEFILGVFRGLVPLAILDMIASFSFLTHFDTISRGLIEARDFLFFASVILLFNFTTTLVVSFKTAGTTSWLKSSRRSYYVSVFIFLLLGFTGLNLIANNLLRRWQYDFTEEKLFTLTSSTRQVLAELPAPVTAKLYYSPILGERNPNIRLMFDKVRLLLQQYIALSDGKFSFAVYDPQPMSDIEDRALNAGLQPLPIIDQNINAYFGITFTDELEHQQAIPFLPEQRQELMEQDLTEAIYLLNYRKKNLGIITSLPMFEDIIENVATPKWEILNQLGRFYKLTNIDNSNSDLNGIDALLIAHPLGLSAELQKKILEYSYQGGKILLFMDVAAEAPRLFSPTNTPLQASQLGDLPTAWGFKFYDEAVVADLGNSSTIDATTNYKNNPDFTQDLIQFYLRGDSFNHEFQATAQLRKMLLTSAGIFAPYQKADIHFIPLLQASPLSEMLPVKVVYEGAHPADILRAFSADKTPKYLAARIISKDATKPFELIVVGDSDLLYDNFWTVHQTILENNYAIPVLDNANFVFNSLDTLLGNNTLISLRGKSAYNREFDDIEAARRQAGRDFKIQEKAILDEINKTKQSLQEIWNKKNFEGRNTFTSDELALIAGIRQTIDNQRRALYEIRTTLSQNLRHQENVVNFINIYALPLLILLGLLVMVFANRPVKSEPLAFKINRPLLYIAIGSLTLLLLGAAAVYYNNHQELSDYEGQPVFSALPQQINQITSISLQNHEQKLNFYLQDGVWKLREFPHQLVYQQRLRSFLSALLEATYYEKKTSDMTKLEQFGLSPLEAPNSIATRIELRGKNDRVLSEFEIGRYDVDLGRGSKGAYLKLANQFQVWLANIDLVDLSLAPANWSYGTAWNLRFGRLQKANGNTNSDELTTLAKTLLNTTFIDSREQPKKMTPLLSIPIITEHGDEVTLEFYKMDNQFYLGYQFSKTTTDSALQSFSAYATAVIYQISAADMEKINHAAILKH